MDVILGQSRSLRFTAPEIVVENRDAALAVPLLPTSTAFVSKHQPPPALCNLRTPPAGYVYRYRQRLLFFVHSFV